MKRHYCDICSGEIESRGQSAMQTIVGDFGAEVTTAEGKTVRVGALVTIDGICGPSGFDMCIGCWATIAPRFVARPRPLTERQKHILSQIENEESRVLGDVRGYTNPGERSVWSKFHLWKGRSDD